MFDKRKSNMILCILFLFHIFGFTLNLIKVVAIRNKLPVNFPCFNKEGGQFDFWDSMLITIFTRQHGVRIV